MKSESGPGRAASTDHHRERTTASEPIDLLREMGQRDVESLGSLLAIAGLDEETISTVTEPNLASWSIHLELAAADSKATCMAGPYLLTSQGRTPLQALTAMGREIGEVRRLLGGQ
jgi:hypothetical protein